MLFIYQTFKLILNQPFLICVAELLLCNVSVNDRRNDSRHLLIVSGILKS
jgi:hypothetical protein